MKKTAMIGLVSVIMAMAAWVWTGCDSAGGTSGVNIAPSSVTLGDPSGTNTAASAVVFNAQVSDALALPLEWRIANAALGSIISQSGSNATYKANAGKTGENIVTVRDQYGNEGSAVVTQL